MENSFSVWRTSCTVKKDRTYSLWTVWGNSKLNYVYVKFGILQEQRFIQKIHIIRHRARIKIAAKKPLISTKEGKIN